MWFFIALLISNPSWSADPNKPHPHQGIPTQFKNPKRSDLTATQEAKLKSGQSVKTQVKAGNGGRGIAVMDIQATPDRVWQIITSFEKYPDWIDELSLCEVYGKSDESVKAKFIISTLMIKVEYYIQHRLHKADGYLTWSLDYSKESDLDDSTGYWLIYPSPADPTKTRVEYSVDIRIKGWVPSFIEDMLADQGLEDATRWVKRESEKG